MKQHEVLNWYEISLPAKERKIRGHFSTPPLLVERILDACGYIPERDLSCLRVLDPACGSGNFIAGAARRLFASEIRRGLAHHACLASVQRNIWGFDPDPVSCFLSEMQLQTVITDVGMQFMIPYPGEIVPPEYNPFEGAMNCAPTFHIHQADGLALAWGEGEVVDLFLANPPYLAAKNNDLSGYRSMLKRGQSDSYLLFLDLALRVVRPNGWIGLVLPDPFLARANAARERQRLLVETTIHHLWHLSDVFAAHVGAVVLIAQKGPASKLHSISWEREKWPAIGTDVSHPPLGLQTAGGCDTSAPTGRTNHIPQAFFLNQSHAELRYLLSTTQNTLIQQLHTHVTTLSQVQSRQFAPLREFVSIRRGEELGKDSRLLSRVAPPEKEGWYPILRGGVDVRPYEQPTGQYWITCGAITKPLERYLAPKLLVVKSTERLKATLDLQGHVALQTLYLLNLRTKHIETFLADAQEDSLYFLMALLNSRLLREYVYVLHTAYKWVQPQIEQHILACLPIPLIETDETHEIIAYAKQLSEPYSQRDTSGDRQIASLCEEIEHGVCKLYEKVVSAERK
jgi:hypothetical protein